MLWFNWAFRALGRIVGRRAQALLGSAGAARGVTTPLWWRYSKAQSFGARPFCCSRADNGQQRVEAALSIDIADIELEAVADRPLRTDAKLSWSGFSGEEIKKADDRPVRPAAATLIGGGVSPRPIRTSPCGNGGPIAIRFRAIRCARSATSAAVQKCFESADGSTSCAPTGGLGWRRWRSRVASRLSMSCGCRKRLDPRRRNRTVLHAGAAGRGSSACRGPPGTDLCADDAPNCPDSALIRASWRIVAVIDEIIHKVNRRAATQIGERLAMTRNPAVARLSCISRRILRSWEERQVNLGAVATERPLK